MILRRVIQHVRKQEWTAITLDFLRSDQEFEIALEVLESGTRNNLGVRRVDKKLAQLQAHMEGILDFAQKTCW